MENFDLYAELGFDVDIHREDIETQHIKKMYKRLCMTMHPDRGGSEEAFKRLTFAYELLSDPAKRAAYDETGGWEDNQADDGLNSIMASLITAIMNHPKLDYINIPKEMRGLVDNQVQEGEKLIWNQKRDMAVDEKIRKRLKGKGKAAFFLKVLDKRIEDYKMNIANAEGGIAKLKKVYEIIQELEDDRPGVPTNQFVDLQGRYVPEGNHGRNPFGG